MRRRAWSGSVAVGLEVEGGGSEVVDGVVDDRCGGGGLEVDVDVDCQWAFSASSDAIRSLS